MKTTRTQTTENAAKMAGIIVPDGCRRIAELFYAGVDRRVIQRRHGVTQHMIDALSAGRATVPTVRTDSGRCQVFSSDHSGVLP